MERHDLVAAAVNPGMNRLAALRMGLALLATVGAISAAHAYSGFPDFLAGRTLKHGGVGCTGCHTGPDPATTITLAGPSVLGRGESAVYTVTASRAGVPNGSRMGAVIAASDSPSPLSVSPGEPMVLTAGEIVHSTGAGALRTTTNGSGSYAFVYTMPADAVPGSTHTLYATSTILYPGGWNHAASFTVTTAAPPSTAPTTTSLASSANPATTGQTITFTATVSSSSGTPAGSVTFKDGAATLCAAVALASAQAQCAVSSLTAGTHSITAEYSGATAFAPSASATLLQTVQAPGATLTITPASVDFGGQSMGTTSAPVTITVTNAGTVAVTLSAISVSDAQFAQSNDCSVLAAGASCAIAVSFSPAAAQGALNSRVAAAATLTVASDAQGSPNAVSLTGSAEKSLVAHYYRSILRRAPDAGGQQFWEQEAARVAGLGANVNEVWYALAMSFYSSGEYLAFGRNPTEYVRDLYTTFFNRTADDAGLAYWTGLLAQGMPREVVLASFMFSGEFSGFAQAIFGNTAARAEVDTVVDFYRGLLSRLPDSPGLDFWLAQFRAAQCQGASAVYAQVEAISSAYAGSPEYAARGRSNSQYIGDLYNAFLRRGGDLEGVAFWIGQLDSGGKTREQVRRDFIASPEFSARVQRIVEQGCLS